MAVSERVKRYRALKQLARKACESRGHMMNAFVEHEMEGQSSFFFASYCSKCGRHVFVSPDPAPNDTFIRGEASAVECFKY